MKQMIDRYEILRSLSKGGMGEIFLVYDPLCKREIVLKQILPKLQKHPIIKARFLREAEVGARLNHPSIIPVFSIDPSAQKNYYTMPYIAGETLKQILKRCLEEEKQKESQDLLMPLKARMRIFLQLCEAVAYAHSKNIVHRDLKPDNVLVGKYGEVLIFDWGLSDFEGCSQREDDIGEEEETNIDLTRPGKLPGTLNYIAPERIQGAPTSQQMDVFSLGVMLYQLLTLRSPFQRKSIKEFKKQGDVETPLSPEERIPYLHIPETLNTLCMRCLEKEPSVRIKTVQEMIDEVKEFLDGKPRWLKTETLDPLSSCDWEFQENILLTKHLALTGSPEVTRWASLMISKPQFLGNFRLDAHFKLEAGSEGISFLIGVPSQEEREHFLQGLQICLGPTSALLCNGATLMTMPGGSILDQNLHLLSIEKAESNLTVFLDHKKIGLYILRTPLPGNHIGLFAYDAEFSLEPLIIRERGTDALVSCLAIPDAFLSHRDFKKARIEYLKIAQSFPGSFEEREAHFRSGISLLEEAKAASSQEDKERALLHSLNEFDLLHHTASAPLEYIGKSLVYKYTQEIEEEIKCLELALRKYKNHTLIPSVQDEIFLRLYETSSVCRTSAYRFALLALSQLPSISLRSEHAPLFTSLKTHLEKIPLFLAEHPIEQALACQLAFWLGKTTSLLELMETADMAVKLDASYSLFMLSEVEGVEENFTLIQEGEAKELLSAALTYFEKGPEQALKKILSFPSSKEQERALYCLLEKALCDEHKEPLVASLNSLPLTPPLDALHILIALKENNLPLATSLFTPYAEQEKKNPYSPLFVAMGYYLYKTQGEEAALSHLSRAPAYSTASLLPQWMKQSKEQRMLWREQKLLFWENTLLQKQLYLYRPIV